MTSAAAVQGGASVGSTPVVGLVRQLREGHISKEELFSQLVAMRGDQASAKVAIDEGDHRRSEASYSPQSANPVLPHEKPYSSPQGRGPPAIFDISPERARASESPTATSPPVPREAWTLLSNDTTFSTDMTSHLYPADEATPASASFTRHVPSTPHAADLSHREPLASIENTRGQPGMHNTTGSSHTYSPYPPAAPTSVDASLAGLASGPSDAWAATSTPPFGNYVQLGASAEGAGVRDAFADVSRASAVPTVREVWSEPVSSYRPDDSSFPRDSMVDDSYGLHLSTDSRVSSASVADPTRVASKSARKSTAKKLSRSLSSISPSYHATHKEDQSFTFTPKTKPLPSNYARRSYELSFAERSQLWQDNRSATQARIREQEKSKEVTECSFKPKINKKVPGSARVKHNLDEPVSERLYHSHQDHYDRAEVERTRVEEEQFRAACTFQPQTGTNRSYGHVKSRFRNPTPTKSRATAVESGLEDATFTPKVNRVSSQMKTAKRYLKEASVFDRLTQSVPTDASMCSDTWDEPPEPHVRKSINATHRGVSPSPSRESLSRVSTSKSFDDFMLRNQATVQKKKIKVEMIEKQVAPKEKPDIDENSKKILKQKKQTNFLERMEREMEKRQLKERILREEEEKKYSFKPEVSTMAKKMARRTTKDRSVGDYRRKLRTQEAISMRIAEEKMKDLTFQPKKISRAYQGVEGRLKILSEPESYLDRLQGQALNQEARAQEELARREKEERSECTFQPQTVQAPAFIRKIAKSFEKSKSSIAGSGQYPEEERSEYTFLPNS
eukprot:Rmarinus@m.8106